MGFNYAKEKREFERKWAAVRRQCEEAGMAPDAIEELHDFDWDWFKSRRRYIDHLADLPDGLSAEDLPQAGDGTGPGDIPTLYGTEQCQWLDAIEDEQLLQKLVLLSKDDLKLLTALAFEERTQTEVSRILHCNQSTVSKNLARIKIFLR